VTTAPGRPPPEPRFAGHAYGNGPGRNLWPVDPFLGPNVGARIALYRWARFARVSKLAPSNLSPASSNGGGSLGIGSVNSPGRKICPPASTRHGVSDTA
jgi:hypothetical protein